MHNLLNLQTLARDRTAAGRQVLTETIGDLFLEQSETLSAHERELMGEILRHLIRDVEISVRKNLAHRLAKVPSAPRDVVVALAGDVIEVASPLLFESVVLGDAELIQIIRDRTREHQLAIAARRSVSEPVSDALVATQDNDVVTVLLNNADARISAATLDYLVEQSARIDGLQNPLLLRRELTPSLAARMYGWVSAALKAQILTRFEIDPLTLAEATHDTLVELESFHRGDFRPKEDEIADQLGQDRSTMPPLIAQALRDGQIPLFLALFAKFTGVPKPMALRMLAEPRGEGLCIACKASGIDRSTFASIYLLSRKARLNVQNVPLSDMSGILALYDRVGAAAAASLLRKWQETNGLVVEGSA